jgi:2-C-methyl-D-erythritol 4-phosphate cytidylyltransferase
MAAERAKQFLDFGGKPLLAVTLEILQGCPAIDCIIPVVPPDDVDFCRREVVEAFGLTKVRGVVAGGERRQDSVRLGIEASGGRYGLVLIHDGVRPCIRASLIERAVAAARRHRAVITGMPAKETVKEVGDDGRVKGTYDRRRVWLVQTPQVFRYEDIMAAHRRAVTEGWEEMTDDALLMERTGIPVTAIEGSQDNIKVTTPHDLDLALFLRRDTRNTEK